MHELNNPLHNVQTQVRLAVGVMLTVATGPPSRSALLGIVHFFQRQTTSSSGVPAIQS